MSQWINLPRQHSSHATTPVVPVHCRLASKRAFAALLSRSAPVWYGGQSYGRTECSRRPKLFVCNATWPLLVGVDAGEGGLPSLQGRFQLYEVRPRSSMCCPGLLPWVLHAIKLREPRQTRAPLIPGSESDRAHSDWTCLAPRSTQGDGSPLPARVVLWSVRETDSGTRAGRALVERETAAHLRLRWERRDGRQRAPGWRAKDRIPTEMDRTGWWQGRAKSTGSGSKPSQKDSQRSISGCIGVPSSSRAPHLGMETCRSSR
eukprot:scaffold358_cov343-Pavlova_lutheri.AAC.36